MVSISSMKLVMPPLFVRSFFGKYPELEEMAKQFSDEEIIRLNRGGHDPKKKSMLPMLKP